MFCPQCGTRLPEGSRFCFQCGERVDPSLIAPTRASAETTAFHQTAEDVPASAGRAGDQSEAQTAFGMVMDIDIVFCSRPGLFRARTCEVFPRRTIASVRLAWWPKPLWAAPLLLIGLQLVANGGSTTAVGYVLLIAGGSVLWMPRIIVDLTNGEHRSSLGLPWQREAATAFVDAYNGRRPQADATPRQQPPRVARDDGRIRQENTPIAPNATSGWFAAIAAVVVIVGSLGPWISAHGLYNRVLNGTDNSSDGVMTLYAAAFAVILLILAIVVRHSPSRRTLAFLAALVLAGCAWLGFHDWHTLSTTVSNSNILGISATVGVESVQVGWGLKTVTVAGGLGALLAVAFAITTPQWNKHGR